MGGDALVGGGFTIGEVLNQLKGEFADITISKIRFLESEGLIAPDRTEAGYRKFSTDDIDRLRFILTAQRDHYLPLRVIREQLERLDAGEIDAPAPGGAEDRPDSAGMSSRRSAELAKALEAAAAGGAERPLLDQPAGQVALTLRELSEATGLDPAEIRELREFGLVGDRDRAEPGDESPTFDGDDLLAARAAHDLLRLGLEARHLRMYRQFVDRELALFEQLVAPLLRQRNPEARRQAVRQLERLTTQTQRMKRSLLAGALRGYLHGG